MIGDGTYNRRFEKAKKAIWFNFEAKDFDLVWAYYEKEGQWWYCATNKYTLRLEGCPLIKARRTELAFTEEEAVERLQKMLGKLAASGERLIKKAFH